MKLTLAVIKAPTDSHLLGRHLMVDESGATLGRAESNTVVLPDPLRYLSSVHARIEFLDNTFFLTDCSTNGVFLNMQTKAIGKGNRIALRQGDQLRLSGYLLEVSKSPVSPGELPATDDSRPQGSETREMPPDVPEIGRASAASAARSGRHTLATLSDEVAAALSAPAPQPLKSGIYEAVSQQPSSAASQTLNLQRFAENLGVTQISDQSLDNLADETVRIVHSTLINLIRLLSARASVKQHFEMNVTGISLPDDNPLKYSLTLEDALQNLFCRAPDKVKSPVDAVNDAFNDLADHQIALLEGIKAGFDAVLNTFDPKNFTAEKSDSSASGEVSREARGEESRASQSDPWSQYLRHFHDLFDEDNSVFNRLVGQALVEAYDATLAELKKKRK